MYDRVFFHRFKSKSEQFVFRCDLPTFQNQRRPLQHANSTNSEMFPNVKLPLKPLKLFHCVSSHNKVNASLCLSALRHCVECQHFQRGQYVDDGSCNRICKDTVKTVEKLGEKHRTLNTSSDALLNDE